MQCMSRQMAQIMSIVRCPTLRPRNRKWVTPGSSVETHLFKSNGLRANILEQSDSFAEEYRYQVYFDLIEPSGFDKLLDGTRTTDHPDIFVGGCGFRLR